MVEDCAEAPVRCQCGEVLGERCEWTGPEADTVTLEYMPEHLRESHRAAQNSGSYPHNGAVRLRCHSECAYGIVEAEEAADEAQEWASVID